jgi:hypothetical protein
MEGSAVGFAEDHDGTDAEFAAGSEYADGDLSAIGDQDFVEHAEFGVLENSNMRL